VTVAEGFGIYLHLTVFYCARDSLSEWSEGTRVSGPQYSPIVHFAIAARIASAIASIETAILSHGAKVSQPCDKKSVESSDMKEMSPGCEFQSATKWARFRQALSTCASTSSNCSLGADAKETAKLAKISFISPLTASNACL